MKQPINIRVDLKEGDIDIFYDLMDIANIEREKEIQKERIEKEKEIQKEKIEREKEIQKEIQKIKIESEAKIKSLEEEM